MVVPKETDRRKCDALLAFSSWTLRTRSACLRIFNTPLEKALFDHMLASSPLAAPFSILPLFGQFHVGPPLFSNSASFSSHKVGSQVVFAKHRQAVLPVVPTPHPNTSHIAASVMQELLEVNCIKKARLFAIPICINKARTVEGFVFTFTPAPLRRR